MCIYWPSVSLTHQTYAHDAAPCTFQHFDIAWKIIRDDALDLVGYLLAETTLESNVVRCGYRHIHS
jgi:hypothetical protein